MKKKTNINLEQQKKSYLLLSCRTRSVLLGSILGDGSLKINKSCINATMAFRHSIKQKEYCFWKRNQLKDDISSKNDINEQISKNVNEFQKHKIRYQSRALPSLTYLFNLVTKKNKIHIKRKWLNLMDPLALMVWWLDDGSLVKNTRQGVFCTDGFLFKDVQVLQKYLKKVWKIETKIYSLKKFNKDGNERFRLWIVSIEELKKFLRIILPHIPIYSMLYKVIILYKDSDLQQRWISEIVENTKFSRQQVELLVQKRKSEYKAFQKMI